MLANTKIQWRIRCQSRLQTKIAASAYSISASSYQNDNGLQVFAVIGFGTSRCRGGVRSSQPASAAFTAADTWPMSALPARRVLTTPITLPMSPGPAAPSSATMAFTAASVSSADMRSGR